jgi:hypothetical protein
MRAGFSRVIYISPDIRPMAAGLEPYCAILDLRTSLSRVCTLSMEPARLEAAHLATKNCWPQHTDKSVTAIIAQARGSVPLARQHAAAERVAKLAIAQQSEVTTEPRNWSVNGRSKSSLRMPSRDSPAGFAMIVAFKSA